MNVAILKTQLAADFITLFAKAANESGMTAEEYAAEMAEVISTRVITHIQTEGIVSTVVTGTAGAVPLIATGSGVIV